MARGKSFHQRPRREKVLDMGGHVKRDRPKKILTMGEHVDIHTIIGSFNTKKDSLVPASSTSLSTTNAVDTAGFVNSTRLPFLA